MPFRLKRWFRLPLFVSAMIFGGESIAVASRTLPYTASTVAVPVLKTSVNDAGQSIQYPRVRTPEVTMLRVKIPPGKTTGWHTHPVPGFAYILSGRLTLVMRDGRQSTFRAGQGFAESVDLLHNGKNLGTEPVDLVVVFLGQKGHPFVVKPKP